MDVVDSGVVVVTVVPVVLVVDSGVVVVTVVPARVQGLWLFMIKNRMSVYRSIEYLQLLY